MARIVLFLLVVTLSCFILARDNSDSIVPVDRISDSDFGGSDTGGVASDFGGSGGGSGGGSDGGSYTGGSGSDAVFSIGSSDSAFTSDTAAAVTSAGSEGFSEDDSESESESEGSEGSGSGSGDCGGSSEDSESESEESESESEESESESENPLDTDTDISVNSDISSDFSNTVGSSDFSNTVGSSDFSNTVGSSDFSNTVGGSDFSGNSVGGEGSDYGGSIGGGSGGGGDIGGRGSDGWSDGTFDGELPLEPVPTLKKRAQKRCSPKKPKHPKHKKAPGKCGGNCPANDCGTDCPCTSSPHYVNVADACSGFADWDQQCCICIVGAESGGNANAAHTNDYGTQDAGLWQINSDYGWTNDVPPCTVEANRDAAVAAWRSGGNTFKRWSSRSKCPGC